MGKLQPEECLQTNSPIHTDKLIAMLERENFVVRPAKGDHFHYSHPDFPWILGGLVYHAKTAFYQHEAANACLQVREERQKPDQQDLQKEWANSANPPSIENQIPVDKFEIVGRTETEVHVRCTKPQTIGMGISLLASPKQIEAQLIQLEKTGRVFNELLGRSKSQYDFEYRVNSDGAIALAHKTYCALKMGIVPYTMDTLGEDPMGQLSEILLEVQIRDNILEEYNDYIASLPFISGIKPSQDKTKGDIYKRLKIHDPVMCKHDKFRVYGTRNERSPLGAIAGIFDNISSKTAASFQAKNLRQYQTFEVTREGEMLHGKFQLDPNITFDIPLLSTRMPQEIQDFDLFDELPIETIEQLLKEARLQIDLVAEAYNNFIDVRDRAQALSTQGKERFDLLALRMKTAGLKALGASNLNPGKKAFFRFYSNTKQIDIEGYATLMEVEPNKPLRKGWKFSQEAVAKAEQDLDNYLRTKSLTKQAEPGLSSAQFSPATKSPLSSAIKSTLQDDDPLNLPDFLKKNL